MGVIKDESSRDLLSRNEDKWDHFIQTENSHVEVDNLLKKKGSKGTMGLLIIMPQSNLQRIHLVTEIACVK